MIGQLAILIVRLYGVSLLIQALGVFYRGGTYIGTVWNGAVSGIAGVVLILAAPFLARMIVKDVAAKDAVIQGERLVEAGAFLIGLYWAVGYLPRAVSQTYLVLSATPDRLGTLVGEGVSERLWTLTVEAWAMVAVGLILIFSVRQLSRLFQWSSRG